jgi:hypothetical protein
MAKALPRGRSVSDRALFGLVSRDGWTWASIKATFWLLVFIVTLGYIPDRAYYFTVNRTLDLGLLGWSPINLCPAENRGLPCPVPAGAVVPWDLSPNQLSLPKARAAGVAAQLGSNLIYAGGSDGTTASATTYVATIDKGNFSAWGDGPALPEARSNAAIAVLNGSAYVVGGDGPDGKPTSTVWSIGIDPESGALGKWTVVEGLTLPEPRSGAAAVAASDGILVVGGRGADGAPTTTVWKTTLDSKGVLGAFVAQPALLHPVSDAIAALEGTYLWVYGGSDANGPSGGVQRASYGSVPAGATATGATSPAPAASPAAAEGVLQWATLDAANLPAARTTAAGFSANGALYLVGGSDGQGARGEVYWALPNATGDLPGGWRHLAETDLPAGGLVDAAPVVTGSTVLLIGGSTTAGPLATSVRASLAPQEPFFRLGLVGVVIPALQIPGEIGQQLGYLAAAGAGTANFAILVAIGWAINHRPRISAWWERRKATRAARAVR